MKNKNYLLLASFVICSNYLSAQWLGATSTTTGYIYRTGNLSLGGGATATNTNLPFTVNAGTIGTRSVFGSNALLGNYSGNANASVFELQSNFTTGETYLALSSGVFPNNAVMNFTANKNFSYNGIINSGFAVPFVIHNGGAERFRIMSTGNVGIGTTNPLGKFQVETGISKIAMGAFYSGAPNYMTNYVGWNAARSGTSFTFDSDGGNNGGGVIATTAGGDMAFITMPTAAPTASAQVKTDAQVNANTRMIIRNDGKVGIGFPSSYPGAYKLYVTGGILTEKVKVAVNGSGAWSDYVFDEEYKLASLSEVEDFILKNKHLKGIPSAKEVATNGIDVAETDASLLMKIEELTLYVIAMDKENKELKNRITNLEKLLK